MTANARNKIVLAGPGTGKTTLFRTVLAGKANTLTLTFVNALVEDLISGTLWAFGGQDFAWIRPAAT